ncbi:hypothetical protein G3480_09765 [Thiorhodococcus mannitoliphagus]|uniref:Uncharacterized protein n=1 Tax=Thiorhodococcus mannitoliphagus TaxID=329406 RepID=A0A6P1DSZ4_9GAMM|nr:hypothetical protein [Thiorhodococcus mannitoliphagus]NEX20590.1 hypothetical protein [Thiorhodococcus mannitoliphagus]
MATISNDQDLRKALDTLSAVQQRVLGCKFAENVKHLIKDERLHRAIATGLQEALTPGELEDAYRAAKGYAVTTYTECGKDTDWLAQADHFVAAAAAAALTPDTLIADKQNRAWKSAVNARMAVNCAIMDDDATPETDEARRQHEIASDFLG